MAQALRERDADMPITLVTACSGDLYDKPMLSVAIARGMAVDKLARESGDQAAQRLGVRLLAHTQAVSITPAAATGVFSSRKLARKLHEDVAFRLLGAGNFPAHRTLSDFRTFHLKELSDLFVQVVRLAREMTCTHCCIHVIAESKPLSEGGRGAPDSPE